MGRSEQIRQGIEALNRRDFAAGDEGFADNVRFHAPGIGVDVEGRDAALERVRAFVEQADVRYQVDDVVEHGPFAVVFARSTGTFDGQVMSWDLCQVMRYEGDEIAETWVLRGGAPRPAAPT